MDERDKRRGGEQVEPGGRPEAPGGLELLPRFLHTHKPPPPADWDRLGSGRKARAWLRAKRLLTEGDELSPADAARLRELREAVRALACANQGGRPEAAAT